MLKKIKEIKNVGVFEKYTNNLIDFGSLNLIYGSNASISYLDFASIIDKIDYYYINNISNNKYYKLINDNKLDRKSIFLSNLYYSKMVAEESSDY